MPLFKNFASLTSFTRGRDERSPLRFHANHGGSIRISSDRAVATRLPSETNEDSEAVVYSERRVRPNEKIYIRVHQNSVDRKTTIRYGFTMLDPGDGRLDTRGQLLSLDIKYSNKDIVFCYYINSRGHISYECGDTKSSTASPICGYEDILREKQYVWAMLFLKGIGSTVQFVENNSPEHLREEIRNPAAEEAMSIRADEECPAVLAPTRPLPSAPPPPSPSPPPSPFPSPFPSSFPSPPTSAFLPPSAPPPPSPSPPPSPQALPRALLLRPPTSPTADSRDNVPAPVTGVAASPDDDERSPLRFHANHGRSIGLSGDRTVATRMPSQTYSDFEAVAYSERPVRPNEKVYIRVQQNSVNCKTTIAYGFTAVDPGNGRRSTAGTLFILDNEYSDTTICYYMNPRGAIRYECGDTKGTAHFSAYSKGSPWAIFLIRGIGSTVQFVENNAPEHIRLLERDTIPEIQNPAREEAVVGPAGFSPLSLESQPRLQQSRVKPVEVEPPVRDEEQPSSGDPPPCSTSGECSICLDRPIDSALCPCGHMCACHACALQLCRDGGARCPICRAHIEKVMRIFKC